MKRLRKAFCISLVFLLLTPCFAIHGFATDDTRLTVSTPSAALKAGDRFEVNITLENNPGIVIFLLYLGYDNTRFDYVSVTKGPVLSTQTLETKNGVFDETQAVRVTNGLRTAPFAGNGIMYTIMFEVKRGAISGNSTFTLTYREGDIVGAPLQPGNRPNNFFPDTIDGTVTVNGVNPPDNTTPNNPNSDSTTSGSPTSGASTSGNPTQGSGSQDKPTPADSSGDGAGPGNVGNGDGGGLVSPSNGDQALPGSIIPGAPSSLPFTDVKDSDWFYGAVRFVHGSELMNGTAVTIFSPNVTMSRAMLVTVLYRLEGAPAITSPNTFADVQNGQWYTNAIIWAAANSIVNGYEGGLFGLNDPITREQVVTILYRYAKFKGQDVSATADLSKFTDKNNISDWAADALKWAVAAGLIEGRTPVTAAPKGTSTRAEVATVLKRYAEGFPGPV